MKRCPECRRDYYDDTLSFCLSDGAELVYGLSPDEPATAILHSSAAPGEAPIRAQIDPIDATAILRTGSEAEPRESLGGVSRKQSISAINAAKPLAILVLAVLVLVGGFFGYRYFSPAKQIESIAVMPFVNVGGSADLEYLSDGVTESLINNLSQLSNLSVKARSSVFRYKGKDIEPQQIANDLKVQTVLSGRVVQRGDSLTISLDLVDGASGNQIWGEQYSRKMGDLAALQADIARDVSRKLRTKITGDEETKVAKNQTQNTEAYQLYLQGRYNWNRRTWETTSKAIEYFQRAIEKDPGYAMAYVGLAEAYLTANLPDEEALPKLKAAATRALEIDPTLGEPHAALGAYAARFEGNPSEFERELHTAIELAPNYATSYHWLGESLVFWGRFDEGLAFYRKALEIEPYSLPIGTDYGIALYHTRQYGAAIDQLKKMIELDPAFYRSYAYLARVYQTTEKFEEALNAYERRLILEGGDPQEIAKAKQSITSALRTSGPKGYWSKMLEITLEGLRNRGSIAPIEVARIYAQMGDRDNAILWLDKALHLRKSSEVLSLKVAPEWDNIRDDPRFKEMVTGRLKLSL